MGVRIQVGASGRAWRRNPGLMDLKLLLRGQREWTRGRIRGILGTAVIVGVAIIFPSASRESSGWGVHDAGCH